jgi:spore germination protein YaaH
MSFAERLNAVYKNNPWLWVILGILVMTVFILWKISPGLRLTSNTADPNSRRIQENPVVNETSTSTVDLAPKQSRLVLAYLSQEDPDSLASFNQHVGQIDIVSPNWYLIGLNGCQIRDKTNTAVQKTILSQKVSIMPVLSNADSGGWRKKETQKLINDPQSRKCMADSAVQAIIKGNYYGLNIDFETLDAGDYQNYGEFLKVLADELHKAGKKLIVNLPVGDLAKDLTAISNPVDAVLVMNYDENYPGGQPGPVASLDWFTNNLNFAFNGLPHQKLMMGIGVYGYNWNLDAHTTAVLKSKDVQSMLSEKGVARIRDASGNLKMWYLDPNNQKHEAWYLDSAAVNQQYSRLNSYPIKGVGLWRLGQEDPGIWEFIGKN